MSDGGGRGLEDLSDEQRALLAHRLSSRRAESSGPGLSRAEPRPEELHEPFPLTELQEAYWVGRSGAFDMGSVAAHSYLEIEDRGLDVDRLQAAWRRLVERHGMLRAVVRPDGRQQILSDVEPYEIERIDLRDAGDDRVEREVRRVRDELSHRIHAVDRWPLFEVRAALLPDDRVRLFVSLDALIADAWSISLLVEEWARLYREPEAGLEPLEISFRDYVRAEKQLEETERYERARTYWLDRLPDLPGPPDLPLSRRPSTLEEPRFVRRTGRLGADRWSRLKERAAAEGLSPASVLLTAYADVLALWGRNRRFTLSVPQFNRLPLHDDVDRLVGEFASFTLLEVDTTGDAPFRERAVRHQERLWEDLDHQLFDGVEVLREMARRREGDDPAMMPVVFTMAPQGGGGRGGLGRGIPEALGEVAWAVNQTPQVWLDNHLSERDGALVCEWDTVDELFRQEMPREMMEAFLAHLRRLADADSAWERSWSRTAPRLVPDDHRRRRTEVNDTDGPLPDAPMHRDVLERARERPDEVAVVAPDRSLTFGELAGLANRWARRLRREGVGPGDVVAVAAEKGWEQPVAALAVSVAGAASLPVNPDDPPARRRRMLETAGVRWVLTQSRLEGTVEWPDGVRTLAVDRTSGADDDPGPLEETAGPDDLAYVLFTSGSTGEPKGVMIEHGGVVNALRATNERFGVGPDDAVLGLTPMYHDMSVYDLFGVPGAGGRLVLPDPDRRREPAHWAERIRTEGVTLWNSVPAMMEMLLEWAEEGDGAGVGDSLRLAFLGGDWIPLSVPGRLDSLVPGAKVVSVGGPTETTLWNIWHPVDEVNPAWESIPYGRPIANTRYHVLEADDLAPRPDGVPGELCCAGVGVARGYLGDEERTRKKFVTHPRTGERIYRTGDLGRWRSDGRLEILGRMDRQVQVRGRRIEPGEIEAALVEHPGVASAVVEGPGGAGDGRRGLVGWVVPEEDGADPTEDELREHLSRTLPDYMVPARFVPLERLPLGPTGKVDRSALPEPDADARKAPAEATAPDGAGGEGGGPVAEVARMAREVLGLDEIDPDAGLVRYGADSIDLVRLGNRLQEAFGDRPRIDEIFRLKTVRALAGYYADRAETVPAAGRAARSGPAGEDRVRARLSAYDVLLDPDQRKAFRDREPGLRRDVSDREGVELVRPGPDEELVERWRARRTHRRYSLRPVPSDAFGRLLSSLYRLELEEGPKYRYASPGGLYPTQLYVHVEPGRVKGVDGGTYYYQPDEHRLAALRRDARIPRDVHIPFINAPVFDEAAFSLFLVADLDAIGPSYGERSLHFVTLEAGIMAHLLETTAAEEGLGLCQIGSVEFDRIRHLFELDDSHVLVHSLVGGRPAGDGPADGADDTDDRLLRQVSELSPEEARELLEARGDSGEEEDGP